MVGDHQKVERTAKASRAGHPGGDLLTACEAKGVLLRKPVHRAGIEGNGRMQMGVAEESGRVGNLRPA